MQSRIQHQMIDAQRFLAAVCLTASLFGVTAASPVQAASYDLTGPSGSGTFGAGVYALPNGNIVVTDPEYSADGKTRIGAVYMYDGGTRNLISKMAGTQSSDRVGSGSVVVLNDGDFIVESPKWANGAITETGAATWCSATTGCPATVALGNSVVGTHTGDNIGNYIYKMAGGAYLIISTDWDRNKGSITHCSSGAVCSGLAVSSANSLVGSISTNGSSLGDYIGFIVQVLPDGSYVSYNPYWNRNETAGSGYGAVVGCPATGCSGVVSTTNSLYGSTLHDSVGSGVTVLGNSDFVVTSYQWHDSSGDIGAATYCASVTDTNCFGKPVSKSNSLTGDKYNQNVGSHGIAALSDGNYVVRSPSWYKTDMGMRVGAATFCSVSGGVSSCTGKVVSETNSLVGTHAGDSIGGGIIALAGGAYVVDSPAWDSYKGAVTYCSSGAACNGHTVSVANSLVGTNSSPNGFNGDQVGNNGIVKMSDGGYIVGSSYWDNGAIDKAGAVTYCPSTGCAGVLSASSSLVGDHPNDMVGNGGGVTELANGAYVVLSSLWNNGVMTQTYAATYCSNNAACSGMVVSTTNSLVGSRAGDEYNWNYLSTYSLPNGNYLIGTSYWSDGGAIAAGALTFCPAGGCTGVVTSTNSLVGSHTNDGVGGSADVVGDGFYVVPNWYWTSGSNANTGAVTLCSVETGCTGAVTPANSVIGQSADDGLLVSYAYDAVHHNLAVGWPTQNKVTFYNLQSELKNTSAALTSSAAPGNTSTYGDSVTFTATVTTTSGVEIPTGQVTFLDNEMALCANVTVADGVATCEKSNLAAGSHLSITAMFTGTGSFNGSISPALSLTVQKAVLTATAKNTSRSYGDSNPVFGSDLAGFKNSETLATSGVTGAANCTSTATSNSPVTGSPYAIDCALGTLSATNYSFAFASGQLTIAKAMLTVTPDDVSRSYGDVNPGFTTTIKGFKNGETSLSAGVGGTASCNSAATPSSPVSGSPYAVNCAQGSLTASNYDFSFASGRLTVTQSTLTVTANSYTRGYGDANPVFGAAYAGFKNSETLGTSGVSGSPSCSSAATTSSPVTDTAYSISCEKGTLSAVNYDFTFESGLLTITHATLTVTASSASRVYGDANPAFDASISGFKNSETLETSGVSGAANCTSSATSNSPVSGSPYTVVCSAGTLSASNYAFVFASGSLTVTQATLTVTADDQSRPYGDPDPTFSVAITGYKNSETLATSGVTGNPNCTTTATVASTVAGGPYPISCAQGTLTAGNYDFTFVSGVLTITRATVVITVGNLDQTYDGISRTIAVTTTPAGLTVVVTYSGTHGTNYDPSHIPPVGPGNYIVTATVDDDNYEPSSVSGRLTIWKRILLILIYG